MRTFRSLRNAIGLGRPKQCRPGYGKGDHRLWGRHTYRVNSGDMGNRLFRRLRELAHVALSNVPQIPNAHLKSGAPGVARSVAKRIVRRCKDPQRLHNRGAALHSRAHPTSFRAM